ncbi:hypothetical protein ACTFIZ_009552 [Dictyostelium cf. discoideum]
MFQNRIRFTSSIIKRIKILIPENVLNLSFIDIKSELPKTISKNVKTLTLQGMDLNFEIGFLNPKLEFLNIIGNTKKITISKDSIPKDIKYLTVPEKFIEDFKNSGVRHEVINQSFFNPL